SAVAAIVILGVEDPRSKRKARFWIALLLGIISTAFVAIGPLIWPALILDAWLVRIRTKHLVILTATALFIVAAYSIGYTMPNDMGMGATGALRHSIQAICVVDLVLGGPISIYSLLLGILGG